MSPGTWEDLADHGRPAVRPSWHLRPDLVLPPPDFRVIIDTREQLPYFERGSWACRGTLKSGDYSLDGYQSRIAVERKSLGDAYGSFGAGRERFARELERLASMDRAAILIEATYADLLDPERLDPCWRSLVRPASVEGSLLAWSHRHGVDVLFGGPRRESQRLAFRWLATWWIEAQERGLPRDDEVEL